MTQPVELLYAIPVGAVIPWFPPPGGTLPPGFAPCDGSLINDPDSPFNNTNAPNLTSSFVLGSGPDIAPGTTGGSIPFNVNGWQIDPLTTGPTVVSKGENGNPNDNAQNNLIVKNNENSSYRFELTTDDDGWNDGNHHHETFVSIPAPGWLALVYIMRIK